jgi:hypothetical protein
MKKEKILFVIQRFEDFDDVTNWKDFGFPYKDEATARKRFDHIYPGRELSYQLIKRTVIDEDIT